MNIEPFKKQFEKLRAEVRRQLAEGIGESDPLIQAQEVNRQLRREIEFLRSCLQRLALDSKVILP